jgi:hypothetical protein
MIFDS